MRVWTISLTRKDEPRIRAVMAALSKQAGVDIGLADTLRWALGHAERLLGIVGVGPGTSSPVGGPVEAKHD